MSFSQKIINEVQEKSAFRCCRCQSIGIEVHHIVPQKDKGPDTFDNAAALCPNCHSWFGANRDKQKEIKHMRDWWYQITEKYYAPTDTNYKLLSDINSKVEALSNNQENTLIDLKKALKIAAIEAIEQMTAGTARITASGIANASVSPSLKDAPSNVTPSLSPSVGGAGGGIFIFSKNFSGTGKILVDGGNGKIGGKAGEIHIETQNNNFKGELSAKGGKSNN